MKRRVNRLSHRLGVELQAQKATNLESGSGGVSYDFMVIEIANGEILLAPNPEIQPSQLIVESIHEFLITHTITFLPAPKHHLLRRDHVVQMSLREEDLVDVIRRQEGDAS